MGNFGNLGNLAGNLGNLAAASGAGDTNLGPNFDINLKINPKQNLKV